MEWLTKHLIVYGVKKVHKQDQRYTDTQKEISHLMHTTDIVADQLYFNIKKAILVVRKCSLSQSFSVSNSYVPVNSKSLGTSGLADQKSCSHSSQYTVHITASIISGLIPHRPEASL